MEEQHNDELTSEKVQQRINELEQRYAELLAEHADPRLLHSIWTEIQLLRDEIDRHRDTK